MIVSSFRPTLLDLDDATLACILRHLPLQDVVSCRRVHSELRRSIDCSDLPISLTCPPQLTRNVAMENLVSRSPRTREVLLVVHDMRDLSFCPVSVLGRITKLRLTATSIPTDHMQQCQMVLRSLCNVTELDLTARWDASQWKASGVDILVQALMRKLQVLKLSLRMNVDLDLSYLPASLRVELAVSDVAGTGAAKRWLDTGGAAIAAARVDLDPMSTGWNWRPRGAGDSGGASTSAISGMEELTWRQISYWRGVREGAARRPVQLCRMLEAARRLAALEVAGVCWQRVPWEQLPASLTHLRVSADFRPRAGAAQRMVTLQLQALTRLVRLQLQQPLPAAQEAIAGGQEAAGLSVVAPDSLKELMLEGVHVHAEEKGSPLLIPGSVTRLALRQCQQWRCHHAAELPPGLQSRLRALEVCDDTHLHHLPRSLRSLVLHASMRQLLPPLVAQLPHLHALQHVHLSSHAVDACLSALPSSVQQLHLTLAARQQGSQLALSHLPLLSSLHVDELCSSTPPSHSCSCSGAPAAPPPPPAGPPTCLLLPPALQLHSVLLEGRCSFQLQVDSPPAAAAAAAPALRPGSPAGEEAAVTSAAVELSPRPLQYL